MVLAPPTTCTSCMACVDVCSHKALDYSIDKFGYYRIDYNKDACVNCGMCTKICPQLNNCKLEGESYPYAAWSEDTDLRKNSASGGIFASLAKFVLGEGGVVYGAAIDGFEVRHIRVDSLEDLYRIQGSKYQQSILKGVYKLVRNDLRSGRVVLFCGLGCQINGLLSSVGNRYIDTLYTVDMICGGLSTMLPMLQLQRSNKYLSIKSFRDKDRGWKPFGYAYSLKMIDINGNTKDLGLNNMVLDTFSSKLIKKSSCLDCQFNGFHRISDCTIGDFWGDCQFKSQHERGLSVLVVHNPRIMELIDKSKITIKSINWIDFIQNNHNFYWTNYKLIRYMPMRTICLYALSRGYDKLAKNMISSWTLAGLILRIYLKINGIFRKKYLKEQFDHVIR